jgi:division protein 1
MTATASALLHQQEGQDPLLSNSSYKKAMRDALHSTNSLALQRRSPHIDLSGSKFATSSEYFKNKFTSSKAAYKVLTHISDDLLQDIPDEKPQTSFTLFQGFNAAIPAIDEEIELSKNLQQGSDFLQKLTSSQKEDQDDYDFKLPNGITKEKIQDSYSTPRLNQYRDQISDNLDLLEIRKNLAASEIIEIDNKISRLQGLRQLVFKRVAKLEQNELFLETHLEEISDRIQMIKDYSMEKPENDENDDDVNTSDVQSPTHTSVNEKKESEDVDTPLLSKSVYGKLQEKPPRFKKKNPRSRKTTPTLQQYYEPGTEIKTIQAHEESVNCFDFDMPFGTMVSASLDNTVRVWDLSRGRCLGLLEGHNAPVQCIQMEDSLVVTGSLDASLKLWDLSKIHDEDEEGPLIHSFESHIEEITALSYHNYNMVSGSQDRTIRQWDLQTGHCQQTIDVLWASQQNLSTSVEPSVIADRTTPFIGALQTYDAALATGTSDGIVRLWDLRSGEVVRSLVGHTGPVTCLQFDERHLATGSTDRSIRIWDLRTGGIHDAFAYESPISSLQFDSRRIVSSNNENTAKIYDRIEERHSSCGGADGSAMINHVRYREGYLVEGRVDGKIGMWAI